MTTRTPRCARLPLTYEESRARFHLAAAGAGLAATAHPITATGPDGQQLGIDTVEIGSPAVAAWDQKPTTGG